MRDWLIRKLGGYPHIQAALADIKTKEDRHAVLSLAVKRLYNTIGANDILKPSSTGEWMFAGKPLTEGQMKLLIAEAHKFSESFLWKVLHADISYQANKKMFSTAITDEQLAMGKFWVYTLDTFSTRLESLKKGKGVFNSK